MNIIIILTSFALVLVLSRIKLPLSLCLFTGAVVMGLWAGMVPPELLEVIKDSLGQADTIYLAAVIILILLISSLMEKAEHLRRIVYAFILVIRNHRLVSALIPALVGLLPMPGGALFSAPLVEKAVEKHQVGREEKTVINYWFRHVWEYWWPLYPGFILAVGLLQVEVWQLMLVQFPLAVFCVIAGTVFLLRPLPDIPDRNDSRPGREGWLMLIKEGMPLILIVGVIGLINIAVRIFQPGGKTLSVPPEITLLIGVIAGLIWVIRVNRLSWSDVWGGLRDKKYLKFIFLVAAIMVFKGVLDNTPLVTGVKSELLAYRIPPLLIIVILPFISGLVTGIALGFVGASFPVILPLIAGLSPLSYLAHAALAYSFGYMGMMLSPVHLCLLVSRDYFQARFTGSYRLLFKLAITVLILTTFYVFMS